jgi:hypothetical protein
MAQVQVVTTAVAMVAITVQAAHGLVSVHLVTVQQMAAQIVDRVVTVHNVQAKIPALNHVTQHLALTATALPALNVMAIEQMQTAAAHHATLSSVHQEVVVQKVAVMLTVEMVAQLVVHVISLNF